MTYAELQAELITVPAARFKETQRGSVKRWINDRYAELWGLEDWSFRKAFATLPVVGGTNVATAPTDMAAPLGIWDNFGNRLIYMPTRDYFTIHLAGTSSGTPGNFTMVNDQILLDPTPSGSASFTIHYDKAVTLLSADGDVPAFPAAYHYLLVHGATATGSVQVNDFTYQFAEQRWTTGIDSMRKDLLAEQSEETQQWGNYMETWRQ
jgi:hypothetical protein